MPVQFAHSLHWAIPLLLLGCVSTDTDSEVPEPNGVDDTGAPRLEILADGDSTLCVPAGQGPFPGALYNHGGLGQVIGGDLEGSCVALAEAGYLAYAKMRRQTTSLSGHIDDVFDGLTALQSDSRVDPSTIHMLGFSRGGLLTLQAATLEAEQLTNGIVLMAPADGNGALDNVLAQAHRVQGRVLILVAENDLAQDDHVALAQKTHDALQAAGVDSQLLLYPPFGNDGHELFQTVGDYWGDVLTFLAPPT